MRCIIVIIRNTVTVHTEFKVFVRLLHSQARADVMKAFMFLILICFVHLVTSENIKCINVNSVKKTKII